MHDTPRPRYTAAQCQIHKTPLDNAESHIVTTQRVRRNHSPGSDAVAVPQQRRRNVPRAPPSSSGASGGKPTSKPPGLAACARGHVNDCTGSAWHSATTAFNRASHFAGPEKDELVPEGAGAAVDAAAPAPDSDATASRNRDATKSDESAKGYQHTNNHNHTHRTRRLHPQPQQQPPPPPPLHPIHQAQFTLLNNKRPRTVLAAAAVATTMTTVQSEK